MIIAPLGAVAIAAHAFAITAESLCYMPGYGVSTAAATLVGQSVGAKDHPLARRYGYITVAFGSAIMAITGVIMFIACPLVFRLLTPVEEVRVVAVQILLHFGLPYWAIFHGGTYWVLLLLLILMLETVLTQGFSAFLTNYCVYPAIKKYMLDVAEDKNN